MAGILVYNYVYQTDFFFFYFVYWVLVCFSPLIRACCVRLVWYTEVGTPPAGLYLRRCSWCLSNPRTRTSFCSTVASDTSARTVAKVLALPVDLSASVSLSVPHPFFPCVLTWYRAGVSLQHQATSCEVRRQVLREGQGSLQGSGCLLFSNKILYSLFSIIMF